MHYIEDQAIVFTGGVRCSFDDIIAETIPMDDCIIVRLENQGWKRTNENVVAVDYKGKILWRIPKRIHGSSESHYVNIYRRSDTIDAYNWDGSILTLDPKNGEILAESMVYTASKRQFQKRQFI